MSRTEPNPEQLALRIQDLEAELAMLRLRPDPRHCFACERDARMSQLLLDKAMRMASVGAWSVDIATGVLTWSDEVFRIHEMPVGDPPTVEQAVHFYAPEARPVIEAALERLIATGEAFDIELPLITAKGKRIWVRGIGDLDRDAAGDPRKLYGVFQEITSQVILAQEQERAREQAEAAARAKSEFLASMSHEIRTPLNGILGMAQVLDQSPLDDAQQGSLAAIQESGTALLALLSDLLDLSKCESGKLSLVTTHFDIESLVDESVDLLRKQQRTDHVDLVIEVADDARGGWKGDPIRTRQVLVDLVGNALKFTEEGEVRIRVARSDGDVRIDVEDTGIGIPDDVCRSLFDPFERVAASGHDPLVGPGLGLAICDRLVRRMGGRIELTSELGAGTRFRVFLPLERTSDAPAASTSARRTGERTLEVRRRSGVSPRILVVEDNPVNQVVARKLVEKLGCEVTLASNGQEGLDSAQESEFDLVLMDCRMPVLDGYEATRRLRCREVELGREPVPVVAMTANAMDGDREECIGAGMDDYVTKPVDRRHLAEVIDRWIEGRRRSVA
ncbi:MAG: ATP-binding protein [Planctomycetota bacterium]